MTDLDIDRDVFDAYDRECEKLAEQVQPMVLEADVDGIAFNGRDWCEEHDIPESVFADAVNYYMDDVTWGVSPMHPFADSKTDRGER